MGCLFKQPFISVMIQTRFVSTSTCYMHTVQKLGFLTKMSSSTLFNLLFVKYVALQEDIWFSIEASLKYHELAGKVNMLLSAISEHNRTVANI